MFVLPSGIELLFVFGCDNIEELEVEGDIVTVEDFFTTFFKPERTNDAAKRDK
jgi:hypothetical protein